MSKRVVRLQLTSAGIDDAIRELDEFKQWIIDRTKVFVEALAAEGMNIASVKFEHATYDGDNDVTCSIEERGENKYAIVVRERLRCSLSLVRVLPILIYTRQDRKRAWYTVRGLKVNKVKDTGMTLTVGTMHTVKRLMVIPQA